MYYLISKQFPFSGLTREHVIDRIMEGKVRFTDT